MIKTSENKLLWWLLILAVSAGASMGSYGILETRAKVQILERGDRDIDSRISHIEAEDEARATQLDRIENKLDKLAVNCGR